MIKRKTHGEIALFKQLFSDNRDFFRVVRILKEEMATDGSSYHLQAETVQDSLECLVNSSFDPAVQSPIQKNDLWLCAFINGDLQNGILIQRIHNLTAPLHPKLVNSGETVLSSREGKRINVSNDHSATLTESAVLGPALVEWLKKLTKEIKGLADDINSLAGNVRTHVHPTTTPGSPTLAPTPPNTVTSAPEKTAITNLEAKTETDKFLSDLFYIQEKGLNNSPKAGS